MAVLRIVAEPGGAAAFAALLSGRVAVQPGQRIGVLLCGANTDAVHFPSPHCRRKGFRQMTTANNYDARLAEQADAARSRRADCELCALRAGGQHAHDVRPGAARERPACLRRQGGRDLDVRGRLPRAQLRARHPVTGQRPPRHAQPVRRVAMLQCFVNAVPGLAIIRKSRTAPLICWSRCLAMLAPCALCARRRLAAGQCCL